ncbi:hypothetical protein WME75_31685 [Sorangium sp. So ce1014]|uniref:hypothetical protein n=1 Tax=Sorangium sp. So ce1014 TaxID=3133326 RepID=UPI003F5E395D
MSRAALVHVRNSFLLMLVLAALSGCGGESRNAESGSGGIGAAGAGATSGSGGGLDDGGAGSGGASTGGSTTGGSETAGTTTSGTGAAPLTAQCPETIPVPAAECPTQGGSCFYGDCEDGQRTVATCMASRWTVETRPCSTFLCAISEECMPGEICSVYSGGAFWGECIPNPCGTGPVTCECASPGCGQCRVDDSAGGISVTCNLCPSGNCP